MVRTGVGATCSVGQRSTDVHAEHIPWVDVIVHGVASDLRQGAEIKEMTCRMQTTEGQRSSRRPPEPLRRVCV